MSTDDREGRLPLPRVRGRADAALFDFAVAVLRVWVAVVHGLRVTGREHLDGVRGGLVTVANHVHYLDCGMVAGQARRRVTFTAKAENFELPVAGFLVRHLGSVEVPRTPEQHAAFEPVVRARIRAGEAVHFYPEGELIPYDRTLRPFRHGAFTYACRLGVPVVPMVLTYGRRPWWRRRPPFRLTILEAQRPTGDGPEAAADLMARCRAAMEQVVAQAEAG